VPTIMCDIVVELKWWTVHLGSHNYGIETLETTPPQDHKLSQPDEGIRGPQLPFITFAAKSREAAEQFVKRLNYLAAKYHMDALDLASLVKAAGRLME